MKNDAKGALIVYSGPSGCGKGTVMTQVLAERDDTAMSVSVTTRAPRPGEVDGKDYFFIDRNAFERMVAAGELLEHAEYNGNLYGTPRAAVERQLLAGRNVVLEIDVQGAEQIMDSGADAVTIFLAPPSMQELARRLRKRGTEEESVMARRLAIARQEMSHAHRYQFFVINDVLEKAVRDIHAILDAERLRYSRARIDWEDE
ncbi:MAG: guanylate kinase [Clostridia bacterium]|nr:guanylate kinase [Clostridia bacterium]